MKQGHNGKITKAARIQLHRVSKHKAPTISEVRSRRLTAAAKVRTDRGNFDAEYEEENWLDPETQIARLLGDFSARSAWIAPD